jgi:hypothetical protein
MEYILVLGLAIIAMAILLPAFTYVATKDQRGLSEKSSHSRFSKASISDEIDQAETDVQAALSDIDPDDTAALLGRCSQILDDIRRGRF